MLAYEEIDLFDDEFSLLGGFGKREEDKKDIINRFEDGTTVIGSQSIKKRLGTSPHTGKSHMDSKTITSPRI